MRAAMAHYGLDYDDPVYSRAGLGNPYKGWCTLCHYHYETRRNRHCDLEKARREDIESLGFACSTCFHCRSVYPTILGHGICPACKVKQDRRDAAVRPRFKRRAKRLRVDDGFGCSERIPSWMLDPYEGPKNG